MDSVAKKKVSKKILTKKKVAKDSDSDEMIFGSKAESTKRKKVHY